MMWVLALDTSSPGGAVALLRDDEPAVERAGDPALSHAERLPRAIADVLAEAGLPPSALDLLAVASGPGAFTGLRVGLATVQGLALALDRPAIGVSALAAAAWRAFAGEPAMAICGVWLDAARGDVFAAAFGRPAAPLPRLAPGRARRRVGGDAGAHPARVARRRARARAAAAGTGAHAAATRPPRPGIRIVAAEAPLAVAVGRIGRRAHLAGQSGPPHALTPLYVRRPDAEVERDRRLGVGRLGTMNVTLRAPDVSPGARRHPGARRGLLPPSLDTCRLRARAGRSGPLFPLRRPRSGRADRGLLLVLAHLRRSPRQQLRGAPVAAAAGARPGRCWPTSWLKPPALGAPRATLEVRASNAPAIALYEGGGFVTIGRRPRYYTHPIEDALILWREPAGDGPGPASGGS